MMNNKELDDLREKILADARGSWDVVDVYHKLYRAIKADALRWAADTAARMERDCNLEMADLVFRAKADGIEAGGEGEDG